MAHYRFSNLLGAPYRGGNLCVNGNHLLTSVGNRVTEVDLQLSSSTTLPCENLTEIQCTAVSPSGLHMISFDTDGRAILVNLRCVSLPQLFFLSPRRFPARPSSPTVYIIISSLFRSTPPPPSQPLSLSPRFACL